MNKGAVADPTEPETWDSVTLTSLRVQCDTMDKTWTPPGGPFPPFSLSKSIRIASTHFADNDTITFLITAKYHCVDSLLGTADLTFTHNATLKAYNKAQLLGQNKDQFGEPAAEMQSQSDILTQFMSDVLTTSHSITPAPGLPARSETGATITGKTTESTVVSFLTHGSHINFVDSNYVDTIWFIWGLPPPVFEIITEVGQKASLYIPQYNIVAFWACGTLNGATECIDAYNTKSTNQAYLGFTDVLRLMLWTRAERDSVSNGMPEHIQRTHGLGNHATVFWDYLWLGYPVVEALRLANNLFPPVRWDGNAHVDLPMQVRTDGLATLRFVYLTLNERTTLGIGLGIYGNWWIETPVTAP